MSRIALYNKYRPKSFNDVIGQDNVITIFKKSIEQGKLPNGILLCGNRGLGKTTLSRILSKAVNCEHINDDLEPCNECLICKGIDDNKSMDYIELDAASNRGVDAIRDRIINKVQFKPRGKFKVMVVDECFHKDTLISTIDGYKKIKDIKKDDIVYNMKGTGKVKNVFKNKVNINRLCIVKLNNGKEIVTTVDHLFFTKDGWVEAKDLIKGECLYENIYMSNMQKEVRIERSESEVLFEEMLRQCKENYVCEGKREEDYIKEMRMVWGRIRSAYKQKYKSSILFSKLCCEKPKYWKDSIGRIKRKNICICKETETNERRSEINKREFDKNDFIKSFPQRRYCKENVEYEKRKWESRLERKQRWKWSNNNSSKKSLRNVNERDTRKCSNGICNISREEDGRLSYELQSRPSLSRFKDSNRGGWQFPQYELWYRERFKERYKTERIRVESVTFYEPGSNGEYFESYIYDREGNYVIFYDLEISECNNYFVEDILVHNCHMLTQESWNAFLKTLEEPPSYCIFILCTTNPEKIPKTILSRIQRYNLKDMTNDNIVTRLQYICDEEDIKVNDEVLYSIARYAKGGMRDSISALDQLSCYGKIDMDLVCDVLGIVPDDICFEIFDNIVNNNRSANLELIDRLVCDGKSIEGLFDTLVKMVRTLLKIVNGLKISKSLANADIGEASIEKLNEYNDKISKTQVNNFIKVLIESEKNIKFASDKQMVMADILDSMMNNSVSVGSSSDVDLSDVYSRLLKLEKAIDEGVAPTEVKSTINNIKQMVNKEDNDEEKPKSKRSESAEKLARLMKGKIK